MSLLEESISVAAPGQAAVVSDSPLKHISEIGESISTSAQTISRRVRRVSFSRFNRDRVTARIRLGFC